MSSDDRKDARTAAEAALDAYIDLVHEGDPPPVDEFCAAHPDCAGELKALIEDFLYVLRAFRRR